MQIFYGVWTPGLGWLKANNEPVAFESKEIAESTAKRIGNHSYADYIDDSLAALENQLLEAERNMVAENLQAELLNAELKKPGIFKFLRRKNGIS